MTALSIHLSFLTANNCEPITQSAEANQMNYTCNLELAWDTMSLVSLAVRGDKRIGSVGWRTKDVMGQSEVGTSSDLGVNVDEEIIEFLFSVPKNSASFVLFHVSQLNCFLFLKHQSLVFKTSRAILIMKGSFVFLRGNSVLMFVKALLSVETIIACLKAGHFYSRAVLRWRKLLKTLRIPMPTSKRCLGNDERDVQLLKALSSDHIPPFSF